MSSVFDRIRNGVAPARERPRVVGVADEESDAVLDALSADTRRALFRALFERPATASELADDLDTSVQNAHYHLSTLCEADLVEAAGHRYSEKGNEMTVYAPACDPLVFVGEHERRRPVREAVVDAVGGVGVIALGAIAVAWGLDRLAGADAGAAAEVGSAGVGAESAAGGLLAGAAPALVFVAACLVLAVAVAVVVRRG